MPAAWHLAQLNIGRIVAPMDDPRMAEFKNALAEINALAENSPGFVWRLKDDSGDATSIQAYADPMMLVNMSVWTDVTALRDYVYRSVHGKFFARRHQWFENSDEVTVVLWWIPAGHVPTVAEAKARLTLLAERGATEAAFTFKKAFSSPTETSAS